MLNPGRHVASIMKGNRHCCLKLAMEGVWVNFLRVICRKRRKNRMHTLLTIWDMESEDCFVHRSSSLHESHCQEKLIGDLVKRFSLISALWQIVCLLYCPWMGLLCGINEFESDRLLRSWLPLADSSGCLYFDIGHGFTKERRLGQHSVFENCRAFQPPTLQASFTDCRGGLVSIVHAVGEWVKRREPVKRGRIDCRGGLLYEG